MRFDLDEARKLCTEAEYRLLVESLAPIIYEFSTDRLRRRVRRAHQLVQLWSRHKDTQQFRAAQQHSESGRRRATTAHVTAQRKAELFEHVLRSFEERLTQISPERRTRSLRDDGTYRRENGKSHGR